MHRSETNVTIRSARDLDGAALVQFYRDVYPERALPELWRWLYRVSASGNPLPLVMLDGERVIGHAGGIPFNALFRNRQLRAQWFVDFALRPGYRSRGLGTELTAEWMKAADVCVTFCNDASMRVFRKLGWIGSRSVEIHTVWLRPSSHARLVGMPPLVRNAANLASRAVNRVVGSFGVGELVLQPLDAAADALRRAMRDNDVSSRQEFRPLRDAEYLAWRLDQSPRRAQYRVYGYGNTTMLVSLGDGEPRRLDVLWISDATVANHAEIRGMLASLVRWAQAEGYSLMRYLPADSALAHSLRALLPVVSRPQFACWTADAKLLRQLEQAPGRWQLLDSDFEWL
jgi:GNAT superfamily N-acetyltransferase